MRPLSVPLRRLTDRLTQPFGLAHLTRCARSGALSRGMAHLLLLPPLLLFAAGIGPIAAAYLGALWQWHSGAQMSMVCSWPNNSGLCFTTSSNPGSFMPEIDMQYFPPHPPTSCPPMAVQYGCR